jgi:hypothetical protein
LGCVGKKIFDILNFPAIPIIPLIPVQTIPFSPV